MIFTDETNRRHRLSSRLIILDPQNRVTLFHMIHKTDVLAGKDYWATPGGGVEPGETYEDAALRELQEETGIQSNNLGPPIAALEFVLQFPSGEQVIAEERYYVVRANNDHVARDGWTEEKRTIIAEHHWGRSRSVGHRYPIFPENLIESVQKALAGD